jgi:DNA-binding response OmpR family regulator
MAERRLRGFNMPLLLRGEFALLAFLGSRPRKWHSTATLSAKVYGREDASARQLVWKYASTLRKKLGTSLPLIEACRLRGYCCAEPIIIADAQVAEREASTQADPQHQA